MAKKKAAKAKKKGNNHYVAAAAAEAAAATAEGVDGVVTGEDGDHAGKSNGESRVSSSDEKRIPIKNVDDDDSVSEKAAASDSSLPSVNGKATTGTKKLEDKEISASSDQSKGDMPPPSLKPKQHAPQQQQQAQQQQQPPPTSTTTATKTASFKEEPTTNGDVKKKPGPNIERMTSGQENFPALHPGRPYCREWVQSDHFVKFIVTFPRCHVTPETTSVELSPDRCLVKHTPSSVPGPESMIKTWGARFPQRVVQDSTRVLIKDDEVHVQCEKAEVGVRWEKLIEEALMPPAERKEEENEEISVVDEKEEDSCVDLSHLKHSWYEKPPDLIVVQVFVKDVAPQHLFVDFEVDALHFRFRTCDAAFLRMQNAAKSPSSSSSAPTTPTTVFRWSIRLKNSVEPTACAFKMSRNNVEITLKKRQLGHWVALEASSIGVRASAAGATVAPLRSQDGAGPSGLRDEKTMGAKTTTTTNSKPTYSSVSYFRDTNDVSSTSSSALRPPSATNQCHTTTVASSSATKPTCMVSPLPASTKSVADSRQQQQREVQVDEMETGAGAYSRSSGYGSSTSSSSVTSFNNAYANGVGNRDISGHVGNYFGMTGLDNMGNTCFMNSVLQCLANTRELRDFFLRGRFQKDLNRDNPLGLGGNLAISYAILLKVLWGGSTSSYAPSKLKSLVAQKVNWGLD